jgi:hypothetical protein
VIKLIDELIEHGAKVDWTDRGIETITNAFNPRNPYVLKKILNACDGNKENYQLPLKSLVIKKMPNGQWI